MDHLCSKKQFYRNINISSLFQLNYTKMLITTTLSVQWRIQTRRLGGSQIGGRQEVFNCLNTKVCLRQSLVVTQKWLPFVGQKVAIFVGRTMRFFREKQVWKRFISLIQKRCETGPKQWASFFTSYTDLVYLQNLKGIKACCAQAFATVLVMRSEISDEQCLKRISNLVSSRTVLLRLRSDNSCPTLGLK